MGINVYGATVDIESAKAILGNKGYDYVDTSRMSQAEKQRIGAGSIVVGGQNAGGGVSQDLSGKGVIRLAGTTAEDTAREILNFASGGIIKEGVTSSKKTVSNTQKVSAPSSMGNTSGVVSPSVDPMAMFNNAQVQQQAQTGVNGTTTSVLSGLTFDNAVGIIVGITFLNVIFSLFRRG